MAKWGVFFCLRRSKARRACVSVDFTLKGQYQDIWFGVRALFVGW